MKRANGTGTVTKLGGVRRRPYIVKISVRNECGRLQQKVLSYHERVAEAQAALDYYNSKLKTAAAAAPDKLSLTVQNIYELWSERKYAKAGKSSLCSYKASWARLSVLADVKMRDVTVDQLQKIIDQDEQNGLSCSSIRNDKVLMKALFKFAIERDIIAKDYSAFLEIPTVGPKNERGVIPDAKMKTLEALASNGVPWADTVLILCYTGFRITEFLALTPASYDSAENALRGGMKTRAGTNRVVPVHPKITPYLQKRLAQGGERIICNGDGGPLSSAHYRAHEFASVMQALDLEGVTPHWCRHTFASKLHAAGAPGLEAKRLLGHANKDITEHYTHTEIEQLRTAILCLS